MKTSQAYLLPPVNDHALLWKECHAGGRALIFTPFVGSFLVLFLLYGAPFFLAASDVEGQRRTVDFYYFALLTFYAVGVAFRATACVAREHEEQTLDMLLQIPEERRSILWAKWYGCFRKGWPWLGLLAANIVGALVVGLDSPLQALWKVLSPWPLLFLFASVALFLSVHLTTVMRARLVFTVFVLTALTCLGQASVHDLVVGPLARLPGPRSEYWYGPLALRTWLLWVATQFVCLVLALIVGCLAAARFAVRGKQG